MTSRKPLQDLTIEVQDGAADNHPEENYTKESKNSTESVPCLFYNLKDCSKFSQFAILSLCVFFFYLLYGVVMEQIFRIPGLKKEGLYLTLVQFIFYTIFAKADLYRQGHSRQISFKTYLILAGATMTTMGLSNASLGYLNYPTQVVFKCCKLIPVLIGSILIQRKMFRMLDFYAAILMCIGLTMFTLADSKVSPNFDSTGVAMISLALVADAVLSNVQEMAMKSCAATNSEVILYSYGIGMIYLVTFLTLSGNLQSGFVAFAADPVENYGLAFIFSLTGYCGANVVLTLVRTFGAFVAVTVTSFRKVLSIVISFLLFSKPFSAQYLFGGLVVLLGIYLNLMAKTNTNIKNHLTILWDMVANHCYCFQKKSRKLMASHV